ncbi:MAG: alpha-L-rhamnosidase, partial [Bacteroidetes bacterium]
MTLYNLKCEYMTTPLGIDERKPRLSWAIRSEKHGSMQAAYRILVSSSPEILNENRGDLWDSGKVLSDQSVHIEYEGKPLVPFMRYWWKVEVWSSECADSVISEASWWETGYLDTGNWEGKWIGLAPENNPKFDKAPDNVGLPSPFLRKEFIVKSKVKRARAYASALGLYEFYINGEKAGSECFAPGWTDYDIRVQYQTFDITGLLHEGSNCAGAILGDGWYTGNVAIVGRHQYGPYPLLFTGV